MKLPPHQKRTSKQLQTSEKASSPLEQINLNAAGIDLGGTEHWVCVPVERAEKNVRRFGCFTPDLNAMADWLIECRITTVAMEATGVYTDSSLSAFGKSRLRGEASECSWG